jgi:hypothetical protein
MWPRLDNCVYFGDFGGVRWVLLVQKRPKGHGSRHDVEHAGMREGKAMALDTALTAHYRYATCRILPRVGCPCLKLAREEEYSKPRSSLAQT